MTQMIAAPDQHRMSLVFKKGWGKTQWYKLWSLFIFVEGKSNFPIGNRLGIRI